MQCVLLNLTVEKQNFLVVPEGRGVTFTIFTPPPLDNIQPLSWCINILWVLVGFDFNFPPISGFNKLLSKKGFLNLLFTFHLSSSSIYDLLVCLGGCMFVCLYTINVKTAEPIGPKLFVVPRLPQSKFYGKQKTKTKQSVLKTIVFQNNHFDNTSRFVNDL